MDPLELFLACSAGAVARVGLDFLAGTNPSFASPSIAVNALRMLCIAVPVIVILRSIRRLDWWFTLIVAGATAMLAGDAFYAMSAVQSWLIDAGREDPFTSNIAYYGTAAVLLAVTVWFCVRGCVAFLQASWQIRLWVVPKAWRWTLVFTDRGASLVAAYVVHFVGLLLGQRQQMSVASLAILALPYAFELFARLAKTPNLGMLDVPDDLSIQEERRWVCEELGVDYTEPSPHDRVFVSAGVLSDHPIVLSRVGTANSSRWIACSGRIRWDKEAWAIPLGVFATMRPDISPLLALPPGWIATSNPADVTYAPDVALTVAKAMHRCRIGELSHELLSHPSSVLEPS